MRDDMNPIEIFMTFVILIAFIFVAFSPFHQKNHFNKTAITQAETKIIGEGKFVSKQDKILILDNKMFELPENKKWQTDQVFIIGQIYQVIETNNAWIVKVKTP